MVPIETALLVAGPDCNCAPSTMDVAVDNQNRRSLGCALSGSFAVEAGRHTVTATAPDYVFDPVSVDISTGEIVSVNLACPTR